MRFPIRKIPANPGPATGCDGAESGIPVLIQRERYQIPNHSRLPVLSVGVPAPPFFPLSVTNLTSIKKNRSIEKQAMDLTYDNFTTLMRSGGDSMVSLCWKLLVRFRKIPGNAVPVAAVFRMSSRLFMQYRHRISAQRNGRERSSYPLPPAARIRGIARTAAPSGDLRGPLEAVPSRGSGLLSCHAPGSYKISHTVLQEPTIGLCPDLPGHLTDDVQNLFPFPVL